MKSKNRSLKINSISCSYHTKLCISFTHLCYGDNFVKINR